MKENARTKRLASTKRRGRGPGDTTTIFIKKQQQQSLTYRGRPAFFPTLGFQFDFRLHPHVVGGRLCNTSLGPHPNQAFPPYDVYRHYTFVEGGLPMILTTLSTYTRLKDTNPHEPTSDMSALLLPMLPGPTEDTHPAPDNRNQPGTLWSQICIDS